MKEENDLTTACAIGIVLLAIIIVLNFASKAITKKTVSEKRRVDGYGRKHTMPKFTVKDLDLYYGDFQALHHSTWKYPQKQIVAFIGPSGCGKSYFPQDLKPDEMTWWKDAGLREKFFWIIRDIYKDIDVIRLRQRVGMVFQQPNPFPMSIYDNVAYGPRIHGIKKKSQLDEIVNVSAPGSDLG